MPSLTLQVHKTDPGFEIQSVSIQKRIGSNAIHSGPWIFRDLPLILSSAQAGDLGKIRGSLIEIHWPPAISSRGAVFKTGVERDLVLIAD